MQYVTQNNENAQNTFLAEELLNYIDGKVEIKDFPNQKLNTFSNMYVLINKTYCAINL